MNKLKFNPNDIDRDIRSFIVALNSIKNVETFSCCSGHEGNAIVHINFRYNKSLELKKVLEFLEKKGFKVEFKEDFSPINSFYMEAIRYYSVTAQLVTKNFNENSVRNFWERLREEFDKSL